MKIQGKNTKNVRSVRLKANRFMIASVQILKSHLKLYSRVTLKQQKKVNGSF